MAWVALAGMALFLLGSVVVRRTLGRIHRGIRFVLLDPRRWSATERMTGVAGVLGVGSLVAGAVAAGVGHGGPAVHLSRAWGWSGAGLRAAGTALMTWAQLSMGPSWRVGVDHDHTTTLVSRGPFRLVRNPIYAAMLGGFGGSALLVPSLWEAVGWTVLLGALQGQVRAVEEPFLLNAHGSDYRQWARRTGRFVPRLGTLGR